MDETETGKVVPIRKGKQAGQSPEFMAKMREKRRAMIDAGDMRAAGGRRRIKLNDDEIKERATQTAADALSSSKVRAYAELDKLLESKDSSDRKFAVKTILEYTEGKPKQVLETPDGGPVTIVYQTAALPPAFVPQALEDAADSG